MVKHPNKKSPSGKDKSNKGKGTSGPSGNSKSSKRGKPSMKFSPLDSKGQYAQVPYAKVKEALVHDILKRKEVLVLVMSLGALMKKKSSISSSPH
mgnify:CR=1 FL=1